MRRVILERVLRTDFQNKMTLIFKLRLGRSKLRQPCELLGRETPGRGNRKCKDFEEGKTGVFKEQDRGEGSWSTISS